ncbi:MAG: hypothetical protein ACFFCZ_27190 [Promethearchaeota archaeon]
MSPLVAPRGTQYKNTLDDLFTVSCKKNNHSYIFLQYFYAMGWNRL